VIVALDVTPLITGTTGVARYAAALDVALVRRGVELRRYALGRAVFPVPPATRHVRIPLRVLHRCWAATSFPRAEWLVPRADVLHTLDMVAPPTRRPAVATVHDLDAILYPELHHPRAVQIQQAQVAALRRVGAVLVVSQIVREQLVQRGVADDRIIVAPEGWTPLPSAQPHKGERPYVLSVGTVGLRKAHDVVIAAMADPRLHDFDLILAGPDGPGADAVHALAHEHVRFEGAVSDAKLAALYAGASAFVLASRAEGFGLTVLEAMGTGIPVVVSDAPALVELAGDAALVVPREDPGALADGLVAALTDQASRLRTAGPQRAEHFTWDACAAATIGAYERVLGAA
jgi:glycosyltransferase involved in cell wall biosynthesis